jgi:HupE / UreJ protein
MMSRLSMRCASIPCPSMLRSLRPLAFLLMSALLMAALIAGPAHAHTLSVAHVTVDAGVDRDPSVPGGMRVAQNDAVPVDVELELALRDIALTLPLDADRDEQVTWGELQQAWPALETMALSGLSLSSDLGACALAPRALAVRRYDGGAYAVLGMTARCPGRDGLRLRYGLLFDRDPQHRAIVTLRDGAIAATAVAESGRRVVALAPASRRQFADFVKNGVQHILGGFDHLAFLLSLLLPAALVRLRGEWQPLQNPRQGFGRILGIVTAFTVAHSITLSLSALGWVVPASRWIEPVIAASVLLAALNNVWPLVTARVWAITFAFGLIHGFGFAGALSELGLPQSGRLLSLLGFNLGVELGQLAVVCAALPLLFLLRGKRWYSQRLMPLLSLGIALMAMVWLWQRLAPG